MKTLRKSPRRHAFALALVAGALAPREAVADALNLTQVPLFLVSGVRPNVLVLYDNSESMDGTMAGKLIAGSDPTTRGNIARSVLTSTITSYRNSFNWGLESFAFANGPGYYYTYAYFFGSDSQMVYTNDCVSGISASNGGLRCIANPEPGANGYQYLTYALSGDDPAINDVLYIGGYYGNQLYGRGVYGSTAYDVYMSRGAGNTWDGGSFYNGLGTWGFTPTDAGYLPQTPPNSRMVWVYRAWGYYSDIAGYGVINQPVAPDSSAQYNSLMALLAPETSNPGSPDLKNAALFTPLAGSLATAKSYFANAVGGMATPITQSCQKNFVLLATDGNPTGRTDGSMYDLSQQLNTYDAGSNSWTFSTAANDVFANVTALRTTVVPGRANSFDVQTYVVGLGDSVANPSSVAVLNKMAALGGGNATAYLAADQAALASAFAQISA
ncbi:MAG: pilus assembly protein PilY, partial [Pseudomonadota bacterium]|nr:pilus assembly protein PilY [Pseudomonadota bacterium]